jgi:hypothetical protein
MKKITTLLSVAAITLTINMTAGVALADDSDTCYEVTITNMTRGQIFTPVLVATHRKNVKLFTVGEAVNDELAQLAEGGDVVPLADLLGSMHYKVGAVAVADFDRPGGVFLPGESVSVEIPASGRYNRLSIASMLAITNDGFVALNGVPARPGMHVAPVYDAGSEFNDELAVNIPGPGGEGYNMEGGEGFAHIHAGVHGIGDLAPEEMDWRNPAANVTIKRTRCSSE